jgi:hypothetical protein
MFTKEELLDLRCALRELIGAQERLVGNAHTTQAPEQIIRHRQAHLDRYNTLYAKVEHVLHGMFK